MKRRRWIIMMLAAASVCVRLYVAYLWAARIDTWSAVTYHMTSSPAITLTFDTIVLVQGGGLLNGAKYEYGLLPEGGTDFRSPQVQHGYGYVWESDLLGDQLFIQVCDLWVEWSLSNHVYPNPGRGPIAPIAITATPWKRIQDVDMLDGRLQWIDRIRPHEAMRRLKWLNRPVQHAMTLALGKRRDFDHACAASQRQPTYRPRPRRSIQT